MIRRKRGRKESVLVVLEGVRASVDNKGLAALRKALRDVVRPRDDLLVLIILDPKNCSDSTSNISFSSMCDDYKYNFPFAGQYIRFLRRQVRQKKEFYLQLFRPLYYKCKNNRVKFRAKVAAGLQPKVIVSEEANHVAATWIVMDRCFVDDLNLKPSCVDCSIALVNDDEEAEVHYHPMKKLFRMCKVLTRYLSLQPKFEDHNIDLVHDHSNRVSETSLIMEVNPNPKSPKSQEEPQLQASSSTFKGESEPFSPYLVMEVKSPSNGDTLYENVSCGRFSEALVLPRVPLNLSWEMIVEIGGGLQIEDCLCQHEKFEIYNGFMNDPCLEVMVKRCIGDSSGIVEAEKRVVLSMMHQNILELIGYHESVGTTALVYRRARNGTLNQYLYDSSGKPPLTLQNRLKIAIGIARAVRYMHEECPRGPIVHGALQPYNIFLRHDFQPMISGFGQARWLQMDGQAADCYNRNNDSSTALLKSDIRSFGVLLLRLFGRRSLPEDDEDLIELAQPLLQEGACASHELADPELDVYEFYKVMNAVTLCIKTKPLSRPTITQVVSILTGDKSCAIQSSPSSDGSVQREAISIPC